MVLWLETGGRPGFYRSMRGRSAAGGSRTSGSRQQLALSAARVSESQDLDLQEDRKRFQGRRATDGTVERNTGKVGAQIVLKTGPEHRGGFLNELRPGTVGRPVEVAGIEGKNDHTVPAGLVPGSGLGRTTIALLSLGGRLFRAAGAIVENDMLVACAKGEGRNPQRDEKDHRDGKSGT